MAAKKRRGSQQRHAAGLDFRTLGEALRFPGADPRQWISYGVVEAQTQDDDDPEVTFDDELGPVVKVLLQPSMTPVVCRVSTFVAGNGEGAYHPFVKGDEVIVAIPEGDERAGCCIIGRLNNAIDKFPMESVAGQDPTTNTFGFVRCRTPVIHEYAGPFTIRSALTGALIGLDAKGSVTLLNGDSSGFQIGSDVIGMSTSDGSALLQLDLTNKHITIRLDDAVLTLSASGASPENNTVSVPGSLNIITAGNAATEHAATVEGVANILYQMLLVVGPLLTTPITPSATSAAVGAWFTAAATTPIDPIVLAAVVSAFSAMPPKVPVFPQPTPGIGSTGLFIG